MRVPFFVFVYLREIAVETRVAATRSWAVLIGWHGLRASFAKVAKHLAIVAGRRQRLEQHSDLMRFAAKVGYHVGRNVDLAVAGRSVKIRELRQHRRAFQLARAESL